jgi:tetratricopeptide (TPR) repeat protein
LLALLLALCLTLPTLLVFGRACTFDFVDFDDPLYVKENANVLVGLTGPSLRWAFTTFHGSNWHPLTWLSLQLDVEVFGASPIGMHLTNVLLHLANTLLLFFVLKSMTQAPWRSALVAALFAWHPLHVESVAWVTERKDVLSTLFWLLTMAAYVGYARRPGWGRYALVLAAFAPGLLAKPMLVTMPAVLLLLDYWPLGRMVLPGWAGGGRAPLGDDAPAPACTPISLGRCLVEKLPLFGLALASSAVTMVAQAGAMSTLVKIPVTARIENALVAYTTYLLKTFWPVDLSAFYPHPGIKLPLWQASASGVFLAAITVLVLRELRRRPYLTVGWLWYIGTLVPVIGLVQVGLQALADRYTYVPLIGIFLMSVWGIADWLALRSLPRLVPAAAATAVLGACLAATWLQVGYWEDNLKLWQHAVVATPDSSLAHANLGRALLKQGDNKTGMEHLERALALDPKQPLAQNAIGLSLSQLGERDKAIGHFRKALQVQPNFFDAHANLAWVYLFQGKLDEAVDHYSEALRLQPESAQAQSNLGLALSLKGNWPEAQACHERAVALEPLQGKYYFDLAYVLSEQGRSDAGHEAYRKGLELTPQWLEAANQTAWTMATHPDRRFRNAALAVLRARQACAATGYEQADLLDTLAAAYAEAGRYEDAERTARQAVAQLAATDVPERAAALRARLQLFANHQPFRDFSGNPEKWAPPRNQAGVGQRT